MPHTSSAVKDDDRHPDDFDQYLAGLGEPFTSYCRALLRADDARRREHEATIGGDRVAIRQAALDRDNAITEVYRVKDAAACQLLFALRAAAELYPGVLLQHIHPMFAQKLDRLHTELDHTQTAIVEVEHRLDAVEDAVVAIEHGEAVTV